MVISGNLNEDDDQCNPIGFTNVSLACLTHSHSTTRTQGSHDAKMEELCAQGSCDAKMEELSIISLAAPKKKMPKTSNKITYEVVATVSHGTPILTSYTPIKYWTKAQLSERLAASKNKCR